MPECCDAKLLQVVVRQARENRLVYVILAECRLILPEAQAPQPDHDVHNQRPPSGVAHIMVCLGECVQEAEMSDKAEADSYPHVAVFGVLAALRATICIDPPGMLD